MRNISIYVLSLNYGGAEKVITNVANMLCQDFNVTIKSIYRVSEKPFFALDSKIQVQYLTDLKPNKTEFINAIKSFKLITAFKEGLKSIKILIAKKNVIINSINNDSSEIIITTRKEHNYYLGKYAKPGILKIGQEHNDFASSSDINKVIKGAKNLDYFLPASEFLTNKYQSLLKDYPVTVLYIPHSVEKIELSNTAKEKQLLAVGRLEKVKAFDDLLQVFSYFVLDNPDYKLVIAGDGSEKERLKALAKELKIADKVVFKGKLSSEELADEYQKSKLLISTSKSESFGLIVIEAANYGVPTVAFDSASGFCEIISNNKTGILISNRDIRKMAKAILDVINNDAKLKVLSVAAKKSCSKYYEENVKKMWIDLLNK